ncbi:MAG TPA: outer membrane beta-barrel protein [Gammaproteobacteria bacterium]
MPIARAGKGWIAVPLSCLFAFAAHAQEISGPYVGLGAGFFSYEEQDDETGFVVSDNSGIYRIVGGYQLNSNYAIEVSWGRSGDVEEHLFFPIATPTGFDLVPLTFGVETEIKTLRVLAFAPFSGLSMFGSLGYYDAEIDRSVLIDFPQDPLRDAFKSSESGVTVAGGIQYDWPRIALRGEYEWFDTDDIDTSAINVIAVFRF